MSSLPRPAGSPEADAAEDLSSDSESSDEDAAEIWDESARLPVKPWRCRPQPGTFPRVLVFPELAP